MRRNFTYLKSLLLVMLICAGSGSVWGQQNTEPISSTSGVFFEFKSSYPTFKNDPLYWAASGTVAGGSYLKLAPGSITSPLYKAANNATLTFTYDVAAFGSGSATNTLLLVYEQGNATPIQTTTLKTSSSSTYVTNQTVTIENLKNSFYIVIQGTGDGSKVRGTRLQNFSLTEVVTSSVAEPVFTPEAGTFYESATVTLSAPEADAIYYTTDVTKDPTVDGTVYTSPLTITETTTIKAAAKKGTDFSSVVTAVYQIKKLTAALPYAIDFKSGFGDCVVKKVSGNTEWQSDATNGATINGYDKGNCESWIISPALTAKDITLAFKSTTQYAGKALILLYSADYDPQTMPDPNSATWTDITSMAKWPATGGSLASANSNNVVLNELNSAIRIAFKYVGEGKPAAMWQITDLKIINSTPVSEVNPGDIENITNLANDITLSGNWTKENIETLGGKLNSNTQTSVTFGAGSSVAIDAEDWFDIANANCLKIFADGVSVPTSWTTNIVKVDASGNATSDNITLTDGLPFKASMKITAAQASMTRTGLTADKLSTIYIPFSAPLADGSKAYTFTAVEDRTVVFSPVEDNILKANTPYVIAPAGATLNIAITTPVDIIPEAAPEATTGYAFLGTYTRINAVGKYGFKNGAFALGIEGAAVPAFRAYLEPANPQGAPSTLGIDIDGNGTTDITENVITEGMHIFCTDGIISILTDKTQSVNIYGIDGSLIRTEMLSKGTNTIEGLAKGMYIVNNHKVIVK